MLPRLAIHKDAVHIHTLALVQLEGVFFVVAIVARDFDGDAFFGEWYWPGFRPLDAQPFFFFARSSECCTLALIFFSASICHCFGSTLQESVILLLNFQSSFGSFLGFQVFKFATYSFALLLLFRTFTANW